MLQRSLWWPQWGCPGGLELKPGCICLDIAQPDHLVARGGCFFNPLYLLIVIAERTKPESSNQGPVEQNTHWCVCGCTWKCPCFFISHWNWVKLRPHLLSGCLTLWDDCAHISMWQLKSSCPPLKGMCPLQFPPSTLSFWLIYVTCLVSGHTWI